LWLKIEGEGALDGSFDGAELQALWSHAVGPWFDLQTGVRYDLERGRDLAHLVVGVQGLAPYWIELDAAVFLSDEGDLTAAIEAEHDMRITQRLILQPRAEISFAAQDISERGMGAGLTGLEAGMRLRYEIVPQFAPYLGVEYGARLGETADRARAVGEEPSRLSFLVGIRAWF
jgi:copper resistance protein B